MPHIRRWNDYITVQMLQMILFVLLGYDELYRLNVQIKKCRYITYPNTYTEKMIYICILYNVCKVVRGDLV